MGSGSEKYTGNKTYKKKMPTMDDKYRELQKKSTTSTRNNDKLYQEIDYLKKTY